MIIAAKTLRNQNWLQTHIPWTHIQAFAIHIHVPSLRSTFKSLLHSHSNVCYNQAFAVHSGLLLHIYVFAICSTFASLTPLLPSFGSTFQCLLHAFKFTLHSSLCYTFKSFTIHSSLAIYTFKLLLCYTLPSFRFTFKFLLHTL